MKPVKSLAPMAKWLLRIALATIAYMLYWDTAISFSFKGLSYFIALVFVIFTVVLLLGGFMKKENLTVISGLVICTLSVILMFNSGISINSVLAHLTPAALGFYFMSRGNNG